MPEAHRGHAYFGHQISMAQYGDNLGIEVWAGQPPPGDDLILVASGNELAGIRRAILAEHGAGQTYQGIGDHCSWPGGLCRDNVELFLCPNEHVQAANLARYPHTPAPIVGSPHVEALWKAPPYSRDMPVVAFTAHWEASLCEEMRSAWPWYEQAIEQHCRTYPESTVLHAHPRSAPYMRSRAEQWGIPFIERLDHLVSQAWCVVADNTSVLYEYAALGRPVVVLNAPWYRRDIEHGLRFWKCADVGVQVETPDDLDAAIAIALADPAPIRQRRVDIVHEVFSGGIRGSADRAAAAILAASVTR